MNNKSVFGRMGNQKHDAPSHSKECGIKALVFWMLKEQSTP